MFTPFFLKTTNMKKRLNLFFGGLMAFTILGYILLFTFAKERKTVLMFPESIRQREMNKLYFGNFGILALNIFVLWFVIWLCR